MAFRLDDYRNLIQPRHIVAGLGCADRNLLALSLALFDDSTLTRHMERMFGEALSTVRKLIDEQVEESAAQVHTRMQHWLNSSWSDQQLRLILWITLRQTFALQPRLSVSSHGANVLADDLSAALIHALDPPGAVKSARRWLYSQGWLEQDQPALTLAEVVLPVLDGMLAAQAGQTEDEEDADQRDGRRQQLADALLMMASLSDQDQRQILESTGADATNTSALRNMALVGGSLAAFSAAVSGAGFSAYILAAKASAFIPMVSGPGLVSLVSVLSNPFTVIVGSGLAVYGLGRRAATQARVAIAARVISLLTVQGLGAGQQGIRQALAAFATVPTLNADTGLEPELLNGYQNDWDSIEPIASKPLREPALRTRRAMEQPFDPLTHTERDNAAIMTGLTVGDIVYNIAAINPVVLEATDFARIEELAGTPAFAEYAQDLLSRTPAALTGAVSNIKGYVAEFLAAAQLSAAGHMVSMPEHSNEAGWDLLVDGEKYQVKFHHSLQGIRDHFERYDYPVIANTELVDSIPEELADRVLFVDGLSNELVTGITESSLTAGADLMDPGVPAGALVISALRGMQQWQVGQISSAQVLEQVMLDGAVRVGLAAAGKVVGASAGLLLFGPAGAWVFAAGTPIIAQSQTRRVINLTREYLATPAVRDWREASHAAIDNLCLRLKVLVSARRGQLLEKYRQTPRDTVGSYVRWRLADDGRFLAECGKQLDMLTAEQYPAPEHRFAELGRWLAASGVYQGGYQTELRSVINALKARPPLLNSRDINEVKEAAGEYFNRASEVAGKASDSVVGWGRDLLKNFNKPDGSR